MSNKLFFDLLAELLRDALLFATFAAAIVPLRLLAIIFNYRCHCRHYYRSTADCVCTALRQSSKRQVLWPLRYTRLRAPLDACARGDGFIKSRFDKWRLLPLPGTTAALRNASAILLITLHWPLHCAGSCELLCRHCCVHSLRPCDARSRHKSFHQTDARRKFFCPR